MEVPRLPRGVGVLQLILFQKVGTMSLPSSDSIAFFRTPFLRVYDQSISSRATTSMNSTQLSDEQVVVAVRKENKELYSEIIQRYQSKLSHYLRKFIHDRDELEDVLQAVFIKAYENLYGFDEKRKFSSWIYRIAHNEAINHIKKHARVSVSIDEVGMILLDEKIDLPNGVDQEMLKRKMEDALSEMKEKYRTPLLLYFFEQKSYEEMSEILRIPISTVGTLMARGKKNLRKIFDEYGTPS